MPPSVIYIRFSTAVAFPAHSGAGFLTEDKVTPRVADGRSGPAGVKREGREGKEAVPQSQKCLGSEVGEASALA